MRKAAVFLAIATFLFSSLSFSFHTESGRALSSTEHVFDDTVVYSRSGTGLNVSLTSIPPENKAHNSSVTYTLKIREQYSSWGDLVDPSDYDLSRVSLDYYLISGVILDYDLARAVDALWIYWGDSLNKTHVEEAKALYQNIYGGFSSKSGDTYFGKAVFPELAQGLHNLTIWVRAEFDEVTTYDPLWTAFSKTITFTIDTIAPNVTMLARENTVFEKPEFFLNFTTNEPSCKIKDSLDGQKNVTISGNTTLSGLANGNHNVTVYVTDEAGNTGASETLFFTVNAPEVFPAILVAPTAIVIAVITASLILFARRRRRKEAQQT